MSVGDLIGGVTGIGSALIGNSGAKSAAKASANATREANALQARVYENARGDMSPYLQAGTNALTGLNALAAGDYSGFQSSPDYQFALQQGTQALDRSAAARGALYSGGQLADLTSYGQGLASQQLGSYRNNLLTLAGMGQSAAGQIAGSGQNYANAVGNNSLNNAAMQGASSVAQANNWSQALTGLGGLANNQLQGRTSSFAPAGNNLLGLQAATGQGSRANFGNNLSGLTGSW